MNSLDTMLGRTVFRLWPDLPRDVQEQIFEALPCDPGEKGSIAMLLLDHHPRTANPPKPTELA
jgi:hypothetical protein